MVYRNIYLFVATIFLILSCDENKKEIALALPPHEEGLLIECYLEPGENYRALVSRTMDFFSAKENESSDSLNISIFYEGEEKVLKKVQTADTAYKKQYNYWLPEEVKFEAGKEYEIVVSDGDKISATGKTRFLPKAKIKDIYFKYSEETDSLAAIFVEIEDMPEVKNYYRLVIRGGNPADGYTYEGLWDDSDASGGIVRVYSNYDFIESQRVIVNVYHLEEQYYHFLKSVSQAGESNYNPFMQPASIQSSLKGASGIFTAITLTSDTVVVTKQLH